MKIMSTSFKSSHAGTATVSASSPAPGHHRPMPLPETPGHSRASLGQSLVGVTVPFSWVLVCTRFCLGPPRVHFPVLCKVWWLCDGVNGDLLQEDLCHTQVYCTHSPSPRSCPLMTRTSSGDTKHSSVSASVGSLGPDAHRYI